MYPRSLGHPSRRRHGWLALCIVAPALLLASEARAGDPKPDGDPDQTTQSEVSRILPSLELRIREAFANAHAFVAARLELEVSATRRR